MSHWSVILDAVEEQRPDALHLVQKHISLHSTKSYVAAFGLAAAITECVQVHGERPVMIDVEDLIRFGQDIVSMAMLSSRATWGEFLADRARRRRQAA